MILAISVFPPPFLLLRPLYALSLSFSLPTLLFLLFSFLPFALTPTLPFRFFASESVFLTPIRPFFFFSARVCCCLCSFFSRRAEGLVVRVSLDSRRRLGALRSRKRLVVHHRLRTIDGSGCVRDARARYCFFLSLSLRAYLLLSLGVSFCLFVSPSSLSFSLSLRISPSFSLSFVLPVSFSHFLSPSLSFSLSFSSFLSICVFL